MHVIVRGRVQGVGFRVFVLQAARRHGCTGWVRNEYDGSVEVHAEGSEQMLDELLTEINKGPVLSHVDDMDVEWLTSDHEFDRFRIVR
ncbi:acylphosphatase [bacterium]|nr:acylphosphatase [bacterium]